MPRSKSKDIPPADRFDELFVSNQPALRKVASRLKLSDASRTLSVTALVNETYLKLRQGAPEVQSELHLRQLAAKTMRQILVDAARRRHASKRGGALELVEWDEALEPLARTDREMIALDDALNELGTLDPRQAEMVDLHFFGGWSWHEVADSFNISMATVERDWKVVRRWLLDKIRRV